MSIAKRTTLQYLVGAYFSDIGIWNAALGCWKFSVNNVIVQIPIMRLCILCCPGSVRALDFFVRAFPVHYLRGSGGSSHVIVERKTESRTVVQVRSRWCSSTYRTAIPQDTVRRRRRSMSKVDHTPPLEPMIIVSGVWGLGSEVHHNQEEIMGLNKPSETSKQPRLLQTSVEVEFHQHILSKYARYQSQAHVTPDESPGLLFLLYPKIMPSSRAGNACARLRNRLTNRYEQGLEDTY